MASMSYLSNDKLPDANSRFVGGLDRWLVIVVFIIINGLFVFKYGSRVLGMYSFLPVIALVITYISTDQFQLRKEANIKLTRVVCYAGLLVLILITVLTHVKVPLESLNVDRWSVISSFHEALANGDYPYFATSHMGNPPGPMPIYFTLAYPFYYTGWLELFSAGGYIVTMYFFSLKHKSSSGSLLFVVILLSSAWMYWEVVTRSNIYTVSVLIVAGLAMFKENTKENFSHNVISSLVSGLLLSTRSVFALAYIFFFGKMFLQAKTKHRKYVVLYALVSLLAFTLTFLPFILVYGSMFWEANPFITQSSFLIPIEWTLSFFSIPFFMLCSSNLRVKPFLSMGYILFVTILIYLLYHIFTSGIQAAIIGSKVDLSYFIFCVPFLLYGVVTEGNDIENCLPAVVKKKQPLSL